MATIHARQTARIGLRCKHCSTSSGHTARVTHSLHSGDLLCQLQPFTPSVTRARVDRASGIIHTVKLVRHFQQERPHLSPGGAERGYAFVRGRCLFTSTTPNLAPDESWSKSSGPSKVSGKARMGLFTATFITIARTRWPHRFLSQPSFRPTVWVMSHNASGPTRREGGHEVVSRISAVSSVDLVHSPATTDSIVRELGRGDGHGTPSTPSRPVAAPSFLHRPSQADCEAFIRNIRGSSRY